MGTNEDLLEQAKALELSDSNEAETRKKVIDVVLETVLGWDMRNDIKYEERVSEDGKTTFADYHLITANTGVIVEAKRIGSTFRLPLSQDRKFLLSKLIKNAELEEPIIQVRDYCRKLSVSFAILTNGYQWLIFPGVRNDGIPWEKSDTIAFYSLEDILGIERSNFSDTLSRESIISGSLERELLGRREDQYVSRRLKTSFQNTANRPSNPIYPLLEDAITIAFSEAIADQDEELLERCYVKTPDRTKFDAKLDIQITKRRSLFSEAPIRPMKSADSEKAQAIIQATKVLRPLAMLVLGSVGSGKTTFLQHTRKVSLKKYFVDDFTHLPPLWIEVDFRDYDSSLSTADFIYNKLYSFIISMPDIFNFERVIQSSYKKDIDSLKAGPLQLISKDANAVNTRIVDMLEREHRDKHRYVDKLIQYYTSKAPVFLVIDNVDQFDNEDFQSEIFGISVAFSRKNFLNLIISMREITYVKHKASPVFDAFDFDPIQIDPPDIASVLSKRFAYAKILSKGKSGSFIAPNGSSVEVEDVSILIDLIQRSVLGTEIGTTIAALSTNDIRLALRMTRLFLESGYTDPAKALSHYKDGRPYTMPRHEALKAILLSGHSVYAEKTSAIANPFDSMQSRTKIQMLRCYILSVLVRMAGDSSFEAVQVSDIIARLNKVGFSKEDALNTLIGLTKNRYLQTASYEEPKIHSLMSPTRLGALVINDLITQMAFLECMMMDTFIFDDHSWTILNDLSTQIERTRDIVERVEKRTIRALAYFDFLNTSYQPIETEAKRRGLEIHWCFNPFDSKRAELVRNLEQVLYSAKHIYGIQGI